MSIADWLLSTDGYTPTGAAMNWEPNLLGMAILSGFLATLACVGCAALLGFVAWRRSTFLPVYIMALLAVFMALAGAVFVVDLVMIWTPVFFLSGVLRSCLAVVGLITLLLMPLEIFGPE